MTYLKILEDHPKPWSVGNVLDVAYAETIEAANGDIDLTDVLYYIEALEEENKALKAIIDAALNNYKLAELAYENLKIKE